MGITVADCRELLLPLFRSTLDFAAEQCRRLVTNHPDYVPMYTVGGQWNREGEHAWTLPLVQGGFYPGIFWLLHAHTGSAEWRDLAERYSRPLEPRRFDRAVHDLGFLFFSTYLRWYHRTNDLTLRHVLIDAGRTLALRRQKGGYLASFVGPQSLFIDVMMNVGIILWAANASGDDALREVALEHCRTTQKYLVRPDGGTAHEGIFDVPSGQFLHQATHQGWSAESTWTRGLAWAIYGFTAVHRLSGEEEFLQTARRCAECYLRRVPKGLIPPWDFDVPPDGPQCFDSSAAAITASGLWDLAEQVSDPAEAERYRMSALRMLESLCDAKFLATSRPEWEGILLHGVYHMHKNLGVDESVAWGDHFFVEALVKAVANRSEAAW